MTMHISIDADTEAKLIEYVKARPNSSKSGLIRYALAKLFKSEPPAPRANEQILEEILDRKFNRLPDMTVCMFWSLLVLLETHYPDKSSRIFWGPIVYASSVDKTHKEIATEIREEQERLVEARKRSREE